MDCTRCGNTIKDGHVAIVLLGPSREPLALGPCCYALNVDRKTVTFDADDKDEGRWLIERAARDIARHYKRDATKDEIAQLAREFYEATERLFGPFEVEE